MMTPVLKCLISAVLALGIAGQTVFYLQLCLGLHRSWLTIAVSAALLAFFLWKYGANYGDTHLNSMRHPAIKVCVTLIAVIGIFLTCEALYYPIGGWDAWSCWNLKAKFIYLGQERWREMFDPLLWRSNTQYPLLLPCINVWLWDLTGAAHAWGPMLIGILLTLLCAAVLLFALIGDRHHFILPLILTAAAFFLPFNITLSAGQYSDILVGLLILCIFVCYFFEEPVWAGIFLGFLSFTKTEGLAAAAILTLLIFWQKPKWRKLFLTALAVAGLPTVIFQLFMAPRNEAFINGLLSAAKPATLERLQEVLVYPLYEFLSFKWNGVWALVLLGLVLKWKNAFGNKLRIFGIFFGLYLAVVLVYYQVNTFFEIGWWLQNTFSRILFSLLPSFMLWLGLAL